MSDTDPITILRDHLDRHDLECRANNRGMSDQQRMLIVRDNMSRACAEYLPALLDELEQLRAVAAKATQIEVDDDVSIDKREIGFVVYYGAFHIHGLGRDVVPFDSMLSALAWLRSPEGKTAVEAARKAATCGI